MKDQYKINTRRYLSLKKRDTYGISANDLLIVKQLTKSLLIISTIKRLMIKRGILTEDKRSKLKKVHALILHRIDCQLIVDKSHVLGGLKMKYRPYKFTDFSSSNFSGLFRFRSPADLQRLHDGFGLPDNVKVHTYKTTGEEILMISLVRLSYPHRWEDVERIFPGIKRWKLQRCFYWFLDFMIQNWCYLILNNRDYWAPQMGAMASAIEDKLI